MEFNQEYTDYQLQRNRLRRFIRRTYINHTAALVRGRAVDFGCGIGDLLKLLPPGSVGLEVNKATVEYCRSIGLNVDVYDPTADNYELKFLGLNRFTTLIVSHVLEHLENPDDVLRGFASSCARFGIKRMIVVVPGEKGFAYDKTHRTFIDRDFIRKNNLETLDGFAITLMKHFPFNVAWMGRFFTHNELVVVYDRKSQNGCQ